MNALENALVPANLRRDPNTIPLLVNLLIKVGAQNRGDETLRDVIDGTLLPYVRNLPLLEPFLELGSSDLSGVSDLFNSTRDRLAQFLETLRARDFEIAAERLFADNSRRPRTLDAIGSQFNVTRERVRQIQNNIERQIDAEIGLELTLLAAAVQLEFGPLISKANFDQGLDRMFPIREMDFNASRLRTLVVMRARYRIRNGVYLLPHAYQTAIDLRKRARKMADRVGILDEQRLKSDTGEEFVRHYWHLLCKASGFKRHSGLLALRQSGIAKVKASIMALGRPASVDEIAEETGIAATKLLRTIVTNSSHFVRSDKKHWGLRETIPNVYRGISAMIKARIEADGGSTSLSKILEEFPDLYGVKPISVKAYAHTMQYVIEGDQIRLATENDLHLRNLDSVISGRDTRGFACWSFHVTEAYFRGYSILGLPVEIAHELGCEPNGRKEVPISYPQGCQSLSLIWRLDSTTGASLGYIRSALHALEINAGNTAYLIILPDKTIEVRESVNLQPIAAFNK